jgi:hypothetical protein
MTATWGSPVSGAWRTVSSDYDAKDEIVEVSHTLKIYFEGSISEEDMKNRILETLRGEENVEPIYIEVKWRGVEVLPLPAVLFDVKYQYRSRGVLVEVIIILILMCILAWLGIQLVERINETIRVMPEPVKWAVAGGGVALAILALFLIISAIRRD